MQRIVGGKYELPRDLQLSEACQDLIAKIFVPDPNKRIKTEDIKRHAWLSGKLLAHPQIQADYF